MKLLALLLCFVVCGSLGINLVDHKYEDVFIVIQKTVAEDPQIIDKIKELFTEASSLLFNATHNRVYFGKISIIIPKGWTNITNTKPIPSIKLKNYILVDEGQIKNPFVKSTECGKEGLFLYLPPSFLMKEGETGYGRKDKVIVHEWGQLRWGLFSEYHTSRDKKFYLDEGQWKPTVCTEQIQGRIGIGRFCGHSGHVCYPDHGDTRMPDKCRFCPHPIQTANASIMGYHYIDSVNFFCDKDDPSVPVWQRHNSKAPTKQNLLCNGKSAWEVMREHSDFQSDASLPENTDTVPEFDVLKETNAIRVFVLDRSGSMDNEDRIGQLSRTGTYIIDSVLEIGSWLGIVLFNSASSEGAQITQITSDNDKQNLIAALPTAASGGTCIGCGIITAIEMLERKFGTAANSEIILMSDGKDYDPAKLEIGTRRAIASKVVIHAVSISQQADSRMISIAADTGGKHYTYLDKGNISFAAVFSQVISISVTEISSKPETLLFDDVKEPKSTISFHFEMETGSGLNTTISVLTKHKSNVKLTMEVTGPNAAYFREVEGTSLTYQIPGVLAAGLYQVNVTSSQATAWDYTVSSLPSGSNQIKTTTHLSKTAMDFNTAPNEMPVVYAEISRGFAPVTNVDVFALVEGTSGLLCNLTLRDNGQEPDNGADDGTYSAFILPNCMENQRLNLRVEISGKKGRALVHNNLPGAIAIEEPEIEYDVLEDSFQRFSIPEPLFVENLPPPEAIDLPPGRITDLSVVDIKTNKSQHGESRNFTIAWTATGSDMNVGQAVSYDIRIAEEIDTILYNFTNAEKFRPGNDTLLPKPSGSPEAIKISVNADKSYTGTAFLGIVAVDENNNSGKVSNVVSILVAKGFRIEVEEVKNYTKGMFNNTIEVYISDKQLSFKFDSIFNYIMIFAAFVAMLAAFVALHKLFMAH